MSQEELNVLWYDWEGGFARPSQLPPLGDWRVWLILAGRGWGKTRTGAEWVRAQIESGACRRMILVARTASDVRDVMVEGEGGLLSVCPPWNRPIWTPSTRRLQWSNGAYALTFSADEPDVLRGKQSDGAWADELAAWRRPEAWDQLLMGLRLGDDPKVVVTTTPRATPIIKGLIAQATTRVTGGSTYENWANLAPAFIEQIIQRYEGTRLGRQELYAQVLDDNPGALWTRDCIEKLRCVRVPELMRLVVGVDPAISTGEGADETGIVAAGIGRDGHLYVLDDRSLRASPNGWASATLSLYHTLKADRIVAEVNQGGDMVIATLRTIDPHVPIHAVHASRGKAVRAEPIAAFYEQGKAHHVGTFPELEDQLCQWTPAENYSPDRLDALVWAATDLMLGADQSVSIMEY
jgi:phage terminase large subunit-like protein